MVQTSSYSEHPVEVRNLCVSFGTHKVLDGMSLRVKQGEILGIVGGSGSGKSVLMRTIIGLLPKASGSVFLFGRNVDSLDEEELKLIRQRWGVMFQRGALFSSLTVRENIQYPIKEALNLSPEMLEEITLSKLSMVGLEPETMAKMPAELSGGMTKRVALARALALDPEFLFLDEPTSGLDPISATEIDILIKTLKQTLGLTVFLVTHDLKSLNAIADRIAVLADGRIIAEGTIRQMKRHSHPWIRDYFGAEQERTGKQKKPLPAKEK
ncbi:MAG: ABC transporter ATP-binding protein [Rhizobiaceae bacterium]